MTHDVIAVIIQHCHTFLCFTCVKRTFCFYFFMLRAHCYIKLCKQKI